jgi:hypothetical protein
MTVKKHKDAIKNIQQALKYLHEQKRQTKARILSLKYDAAGNRRPETGPERDGIWQSYVWGTRPQVRLAHLALGFLKGRSYKAMEPCCHPENPPSHYGILEAIHAACGEDAVLKAEWTLTRIRKLIEEGTDPAAQEAA